MPWFDNAPETHYIPEHDEFQQRDEWSAWEQEQQFLDALDEAKELMMSLPRDARQKAAEKFVRRYESPSFGVTFEDANNAYTAALR